VKGPNIPHRWLAAKTTVFAIELAGAFVSDLKARCRRVQTILTLAPWLLGTLFVLLIYWPLPKFILGPTIVGSIFWLFAVAGAIFSKVPPCNVNAASTLTLSDLIAIIVAVGMVWSMTNGIRLAH
jgi:hypothetical protein